MLLRYVICARITTPLANTPLGTHKLHSSRCSRTLLLWLMLFSRRSCMMTRISYSHDGSHPTYGTIYRM